MSTRPNKFVSRPSATISVAGLAAHARADKSVTIADVLAATLTSGLFGLAIAAVWCLRFNGADHPVFMAGVSFLAGAGAMNLVDLVSGCSGSGTS